MNKKKITKIISFLLVLILLISFPLETQANAVALELGWVTWALISFLTASGFTFAATGGIEALQNEVEQQVDEYYTVTGIDLYQLIVQSLRMRPSNNGNGNGFWFGVGAVVAIGEFIEWARSNGWLGGTTISNNSEEYYILTNVDGNQVPFRLSRAAGNDIDTSSNYVVRQVREINDIYTFPSNFWGSSYVWNNDLKIFNNPFATQKFTYQIYYNSIGNAYYQRQYFYDSVTNEQKNVSNAKLFSSSQFTFTTSGGTLNIPFESIEGITMYPLFTNGKVTTIQTALYSNLGYLINITGNSTTYSAGYDDIISINSASTITSPTEVTEFDVQSDEYVEIDFSVFENEATFTDPEELAEAVKQQIIDTGTTPEITTEVKTETQPEPTPLPTPVPTPVPSPEIEDIEDLGLPTLGDAIFSKFPFSLPKDVGRIFALLHAEPVTPYWQVDLTGNALGISSNFEVDLAEYEVLGQITRWFSVVSYCLFLILITRGMIKW